MTTLAVHRVFPGLWPALALALLAASGPLAGCSEEVPPAGGIDETYTLWGALDPTADVQRLRVVPITATISRGDATPLDATVTSTDLATGVETAWRDSVVTFADGTIGHVYQAAFRPAYGSRHVIQVAGSDRPGVRAVVTVPPFIEPYRQQAQFPAGLIYPVLWVDAPRLNRVRARFVLQTEACEVLIVEKEVAPITSRPVEFGWLVDLSFRLELDGELTRLLNEAEGRPIALLSIGLTAEVASEDWRPPGGVFDPEVLVEPSLLTNVEGGFGFVGAAYPSALSWAPTLRELQATPFVARFSGC